jgi:hypothetical protein
VGVLSILQQEDLHWRDRFAEEFAGLNTVK